MKSFLRLAGLGRQELSWKLTLLNASKKQHPLTEVRCFFIGPAYLIMMGEVDLYIISPFHPAANSRLLFIGIAAAFRLEAQTGSGKPFAYVPHGPAGKAGKAEFSGIFRRKAGFVEFDGLVLRLGMNGLVIQGRNFQIPHDLGHGFLEYRCCHLAAVVRSLWRIKHYKADGPGIFRRTESAEGGYVLPFQVSTVHRVQFLGCTGFTGHMIARHLGIGTAAFGHFFSIMSFTSSATFLEMGSPLYSTGVTL